MKAEPRLRLTNVDRYTAPAVWLHWILAVLIVGMLALGWYMMSIEDEPGSGKFFQLHKSIGLGILVLVAVRVLWRLGHRPPPLPAGMPAWQVRVAQWTHWLLYAAMIAMPVAGLIGSSHSKYKLAFFGLALPRLAAPNHDIAETFYTVHSVIAWVLAVLIALHALAGLKHLLFDRDSVFQRMSLARRGR
ncbi:MAG: cytochrome b [Burkholderiaceae bacterium]